MFLTKECDYSIRVIRALADYQKKTAEEICDIEHIPYQFAYKVLKKLERAGFVQSLRGRDGGYLLIKSLDELTILDIVSTIDKNLFVFECLKEDQFCPHKKAASPCAVHLELDRIQAALIHEMRLHPIGEVLSQDEKATEAGISLGDTADQV